MLKIRRYQPADFDTVWHLHKICLQAVNAYAGDGPWDNDLRDIENTYLNDSGEFLVGIYDDRIVAMGALRRSSSERAKIKRMRTHPHYQRRGFGQQILSILEQRARELGYRMLSLDTSVVQAAAQRLYVRNGYKEVGRGQLAGLDSIFYEKQLELL